MISIKLWHQIDREANLCEPVELEGQRYSIGLETDFFPVTDCNVKNNAPLDG